VVDATVPGVTASAPSDATMAEIARRWQGAWVDTEYTGSVQAWSIREDRITVYDAPRRARWEGRISWPSPCHVARTQPVDGGPDDTIASTSTFAFAPDGLHVGLGTVAGGLRRGSRMTACVGDHVYAFDTRTRDCQRWNETMTGDPLTANTECAIDATLGPPALVLRPLEGGSNVRLTFDGDALLSATLAAEVAEAQPSFDAAVQRAGVLAHL
jgi:hypothetical protein